MSSPTELGCIYQMRCIALWNFQQNIMYMKWTLHFLCYGGNFYNTVLTFHAQNLKYKPWLSGCNSAAQPRKDTTHWQDSLYGWSMLLMASSAIRNTFINASLISYQSLTKAKFGLPGNEKALSVAGPLNFLY